MIGVIVFIGIFRLVWHQPRAIGFIEAGMRVGHHGYVVTDFSINFDYIGPFLLSVSTMV